MLKIKIVCVGKVKENYFQSGIDEYLKRISRFADIKLIELVEENYKEVNEGLIEVIKENEGERILSNLSGYVFATAIEGKNYSSDELAKKLDNLSVSGISEITFVIGGSYGLSNKVKSRANELLSFSKMTFPHTMFRLMLSEQIYRALSINNNIKYHK